MNHGTKNVRSGRLELSKSTVYFDGWCPLCRAEIGCYRRMNKAGVLCFVDVSDTMALTLLRTLYAHNSVPKPGFQCGSILANAQSRFRHHLYEV